MVLMIRTSLAVVVGLISIAIAWSTGGGGRRQGDDLNSKSISSFASALSDSTTTTAANDNKDKDMMSILTSYLTAGSDPPLVAPDAWPEKDEPYECIRGLSLQPDETFQLASGNAALDKAYNLALCETYANIQQDNDDDGSGYWIAGNGWTQLWTRDTAYAVEQAAGLLRPDISLNSLVKCVEEWPIAQVEVVAAAAAATRDNNETIVNKTVWYQDECGHFGTWPNLTDAIVGARGAWSLYLYTGNTTFLSWAYETTFWSLQRAEQQVFRDGLFHGCSSFMESNGGYPARYKLNGEAVSNTKALSTNVLYYNGYYYASKMGKILQELVESGKGDESLLSRSALLLVGDKIIDELETKAKALAQEIKDRFWLMEKGYYSYLEDENMKTLVQMEGLGEALVLLSENLENVTSTNNGVERIQSILNNTFFHQLGTPCLWPQFDLGEQDIYDYKTISQRYHNGRIWPFVQGYWAIAAARHGRIDVFARELVALTRLSELKNTFAEYYELDASFPMKRRRQLWSATGYLGMIYQGLFGMVFQVDGIMFHPSKPTLEEHDLGVGDTIALTKVRYRRAEIDVFVSGYGNEVSSCRINGIMKDSPFLSADAIGRHVVEIVLEENKR